MRELLEAGRKRTAEYGRDFEITERTVEEVVNRFNSSCTEVQSVFSAIRASQPKAR